MRQAQVRVRFPADELEARADDLAGFVSQLPGPGRSAEGQAAAEAALAEAWAARRAGAAHIELDLTGALPELGEPAGSTIESLWQACRSSGLEGVVDIVLGDVRPARPRWLAYNALQAAGASVFDVHQPWVGSTEAAADLAVLGWRHAAGWHLCTVGLSDATLVGPASRGAELSIAVGGGEEPPTWAVRALLLSGRSLLKHGRLLRISAADILPRSVGALDSFALREDPRLSGVCTVDGQVTVWELLGLHRDERELVEGWTPSRFLAEVAPLLPSLNDPGRDSLLDHFLLGPRLRQAAEVEGGGLASLRLRLMRIDVDARGGELILGARGAEALARHVRTRLLRGHPLVLAGPRGRMVLVPAPRARVDVDGETCRVELPPLSIHQTARALEAGPGRRGLAWPGRWTLRCLPPPTWRYGTPFER